ncbi:hypothetical protein LSAT2_020296 [Lamellibrachia satsuma]|nr:hypothetical protein LSAT2_020296 [Lamellibrachia satsuma]
MLVFQAGSTLTRGQHRMPWPQVSMTGDAASGRLHCSECGKHFTTNCGLKLHIAIHKGNYPYYCQICGRGFASTNSLKGHLVQHTGIKAFVCHICHKKFSYSSTMKAHIKQFHSDTV